MTAAAQAEEGSKLIADWSSMAGRKRRVYFLLDPDKEEWLLGLVGASDTLSFNGALDDAIETHPSYQSHRQRLKGDTPYKMTFAKRLRRGLAARKANKRRSGNKL